VFSFTDATIHYIEGMPGWGATFAGRPTSAFNPDWLWGKYEYIEAGGGVYTDTDSWLGWLEISQSPWVWHVDSAHWFYITEPVATAGRGWIFIPVQ